MGLLLSAPSLSHYILGPQGSDFTGESPIPKDLLCLECAVFCKCLWQWSGAQQWPFSIVMLLVLKSLRRRKFMSGWVLRVCLEALRSRTEDKKKNTSLKFKAKTNRQSSWNVFLWWLEERGASRCWCVASSSVLFTYLYLPHLCFSVLISKLMYPAVIWHLIECWIDYSNWTNPNPNSDFSL